MAAELTEHVGYEKHDVAGRSSGNSRNGRLCDELLSRGWFNSMREAKVVIESWRKHYNTERPHSALGYQTPTEFRESLAYGSVSPKLEFNHLTIKPKT